MKFPKIVYLNIFLACIWSFDAILNLCSQKYGLASLNLLCVACWSVLGYVNMCPWLKFKKQKKEEFLAAMARQQEKETKEKELKQFEIW